MSLTPAQQNQASKGDAFADTIWDQHIKDAPDNWYLVGLILKLLALHAAANGPIQTQLVLSAIRKGLESLGVMKLKMPQRR